jgi:AraC-like DNA-binding protein
MSPAAYARTVPITSIDTGLLPPARRLAAVRSFLEDAGLPAAVAFHGPPNASRHRRSAHRITTAVTAFEVAGTGTRLAGAQPQGRAASLVYVVLQVEGGARIRFPGLEAAMRPGQLVLLDATGPLHWEWSGHARQRAIAVGYDDLGLPPAAVREAAGVLETSPVYDLVRAHLTGGPLCQGQPLAPTVRLMLATAFTELIRALIASAGRPAPVPQGKDDMRAQVADFIERNLHDPCLTPQSIARAHSVSLRQLYYMWAGASLPVSEWIIAARLERARHHLAREPHAMVSQVAHHCGFANATHFARRFRQAYGMTPREWQQRHRIR